MVAMWRYGMKATNNRYAHVGRAVKVTPETTLYLALATSLHSAQRPRDMRVRVKHKPHREDDPTRKSFVDRHQRVLAKG